MSDTWAIAGVTKSITALLDRAAVDDPGFSPVDIFTKAPDRVLVDDAALNRRKLNLFLYRVGRNGALANADLPFRNGNGDLVGQPVVALDLHYLLTAYGRAHDELDAQHLLAHALSLIHDNGVLRTDHIRTALAGTPALASSRLADQIERLTVAHEPLTDEDLFRMWTTFGSSYRVSVGCCATVVLVQRTKPTVAAPPVRIANLTVATARRPIVETLSPQPVTSGATLSIRGLNLRADEVLVRLPSGDVTPALVRDDLVEITLPTTLRAGPNTVQVVHRIALKGGSGSRPFAVSDVVPFTLAPKITTALPASAPRGGTLSLGVVPPVHRSQQVLAVLGNVAIERQLAASAPATTSTLAFKVPSTLAAGSVALRVEVDGAQSALTVDAQGNVTAPKAVVA